jgi:chromosome segregation ATPase
MALASASIALPLVRLEVRAGGGRPTVYEVGDGGFLMGGVPGCDLRLPGGNVAPVVCLISRHARGASLRKLAPVQPIAVNGRNVGSTYLNTGDRITVGVVEVVVSLAPGAEAAVSDEPAQEIAARRAELQAQSEQLEKERAVWLRRRDEIEALCRRQTEAAEAASQQLREQENELMAVRADMERREQAWRNGEENLDRQRQEWQPRVEEAEKQHTEARGLRRQMSQIREQLYERYRNRRDRLNEKHKTLRRAAKHLQERKGQIEAETVQFDTVRQELALGREENEARAAQLERERTLLADQHRQIVERQQEVQKHLAERVGECEEREHKAMDDRAALEKSQRQHQADLVRLDRIQAQHDQRQKQLETRALEVDHRYEGLQRDLRDLEEQAAQMDEWHNRLTGETEKLAQRKQEHEAVAAQVEQRAAALEGQQAMLATLRTRTERMREELRTQEEALSDQRAMQEASELDLTTRKEEARRLREGLDNDLELRKEERRRFDEGRVVLDAAVAQLRQTQESHESRETELNQRQMEQDATAGEQAEQVGLLTARAGQLEALHTRLTADRQTLREREESLTQAEQTLTSLQEQLRRRSEELNERQQAQTVEEQRLRDESALLEEQKQTAEQERQTKATDLENLRKELSDRAAEMDALSQELVRRDESVRTQEERLRESEFSLTGQRQALAAERIAWEVDRQAATETAECAKREFEAARAEWLDLIRTLPELESRATVGMDRLLQAREQLREHLGEIHEYARQSREDLEAARQHVQAESERVLQQDLALRVARDEHRLAVAAFRQQLLEWQGRVGEMKQALLQGSTQLERRQAEVHEQAQEIASTSARLAQQAEQLQEKERQVADRRSEMDRHLNDMREWYRRKLRELSGVDAAAREAALAEADAVFMPAPAAGATEERGILSLNKDAEPGDHQLGDLLRSLELVDADALNALLLEARRQRRSLRQLLLAGNYLTLYQMALIEAGNLDGLVLGLVRVIDRLQAGPREAVFRVFDPRRNGEALLRWLAEAEMQDAVRPDEFRQRFAAAAAVCHVNIAATYEVNDLAGRPAVLQEWLTGVAGPDWPALASAPGVWFRLLSQAALALRTAHEAGLVHGALEPSSLVCTPEGVVKLCGLGQPRWLAASPPSDGVEADEAGDLRALGRIAAGWATTGPTAQRKGKARPDALQAVLNRLPGEQGTPYASAAELLEDLDRVSAEAPANATAWERFVREVREQAVDAGWRRSA